jgi:large subunit ribosomal protein L24
MKKIRKGDDVMVITGKDRGRRGTVLNTFADGRALVQNINMVKKHLKPNPNQGRTGGIVEKEMPIAVSNIMLYNPATAKGDRVSFKTLEDGRKVRVFRSNGEVVDA